MSTPQGVPGPGILVIGEALMDIVVRPGADADEFCGGSPANVALGLARLGHRTSLLTRIGDDPRGQRILAFLNQSNVAVLPESITSAATSTATAHLDPAGIASYDFDIDWRLPGTPVLREHPQAVHTGSIAAFLQPGGDAVIEILREAAAGATVSYDPNARPALMGEATAARARVEEIVRLCDVVKVSDEDLEWLAPGEDPVEVITAWQATGPAIVVLTLGADGATAVTSGNTVTVPAPKVSVEDTVGAGDSFMAALLTFLADHELLGREHREALRAIDGAALQAMLDQAVRVSALTCTRAGANPPTRGELAAWTV